MRTLNVRILLPIAALLCLSAANPARAQAPLAPAQMSPRTLFYLIWHGVPSAEARKVNALLALWDDADFAPVRSALAAGMLDSSAAKPAQAKLTPEQQQDFGGGVGGTIRSGSRSQGEPGRRPAGIFSARSGLEESGGRFEGWGHAGRTSSRSCEARRGALSERPYHV